MMRMNRSMEPIYAAAISQGLGKEDSLCNALRQVLDAGFVIDAGCVFLRKEYGDHTWQMSDSDCTQREMFINHLHIEGVVDENTVPLQLFGQGLAYASALYNRMACLYSEKLFRVVLSLEEIILDESGLNIAPEHFSSERFLRSALDQTIPVWERCSCTVRFYQVRPNEPSALAEDLDEYQSNALLIIEECGS